MLAFSTRDDTDTEETGFREALRAASREDGGASIRPMSDVDLDRILELRTVVNWAADPRAFDLLRGIRDARWAVAETPDGSLAGMVGAVPFGGIGILCHLAVHDDYRNLGLGARLSAWAILYLRSRGASTVRLYSTRRAEKLYRSMGFRPAVQRTIYRLDEASRNPLARQEADGHHVGTMLFGDLPEIYGVDHWTYGADRSALIFATLRLHPGRGLVARDSAGRVKGYLIRGEAGHATGHATRIGPFVASEPGVARLLLQNALDGAEGAAIEVTVPGPGNGPAHALLKEFGFTGRRDRLRMDLGEKLCSCRSALTHYGTTPYLAT
ncbi:MAG TPA: GNAT family N-acetyltransferase [Rubrobacteraceae bacterium]|nr:GNAT family N-acetyltransferase [Rubrobacteraceae bacterium]